MKKITIYKKNVIKPKNTLIKSKSNDDPLSTITDLAGKFLS